MDDETRATFMADRIAATDAEVVACRVQSNGATSGP
jgi:hypothetical protein